jgi:hypothetical protein
MNGGKSSPVPKTGRTSFACWPDLWTTKSPVKPGTPGGPASPQNNRWFGADYNVASEKVSPDVQPKSVFEKVDPDRS